MRFLHTMLRVGDLEKSIDFYTRIMGMKQLRRSENQAYKYTLVFMGYGDEQSHTVLELTYNWGVDRYEQGTAFGHIAIEAKDIYEMCRLVTQKGGTVTRQPGPVKGGTTEIAFIEDPDGYKIELIQVKKR